MTIAKLRRCKQKIASPNYYRDRAIQMGEIAGSWLAEYYLATPNTWSSVLADKMHTRYRHRALRYALKARVRGWNESLDYQS